MPNIDKHSADHNDGQQPEALRSLKTASHTGGRKPEQQGMTASRSTAPRKQNPAAKDQEAARILEAGATGRPVTPKPPAR
jgi:hypothetical protein